MSDNKTMEESNQIPTVKVVMIGGPSVGKTCLIQRFYKETYNENSAPTIHANCIQKQISLKTGPIILEVWDTAGEEKFRSFSQLFFRNALGCISVFDATSENSLQSCFEYINDFLDSAPDGKVVVCANKIDLLTTSITESENIQNAQRQCDNEGFSFLVASAKTGEGINELYLCLASAIMNKDTVTTTREVGIKPKKTGNGEKKKCC